MRYIFFCILFFSLVACEGILNLEVVGDGNVVTSDRDLGQFRAIEFYDAFELEVRYAAQQEVSVQADSNLLRYVTTEVSEQRLTIQRLPNYDLFPRKSIRVIVHTPDIRLIDVYGKGTIYLDSLKAGEFELNVYSRATVKINGFEAMTLSVLSNSGGTIHLDGQFEHLFFRQAGSGQAKLRGDSHQAQIIQEGSGIIDAQALDADSITVSLFGSGLVYFNSGNYSSVKINGSGRIYYSGVEPASTSITGEGHLIRY